MGDTYAVKTYERRLLWNGEKEQIFKTQVLIPSSVELEMDGIEARQLFQHKCSVLTADG